MDFYLVFPATFLVLICGYVAIDRLQNRDDSILDYLLSNLSKEDDKTNRPTQGGAS